MSVKQLESIISKMLAGRSGDNSGDIYTWIKAKRREDFRNARRSPLPKSVFYSHFEGDNFQAAIVRSGSVNPDKIILYLHGGSFVSGSAMISRYLVSRISQAANMSVLNVDYRLAPEFGFPDALEDALAAYRWLLKSIYSNKDIAFVGRSTGGHLALSTLSFLKQNREPLPAAVALMSPWINFSGPTEESKKKNVTKDILGNVQIMTSIFNLYRGETDVDNPLINPLKSDLTSFPPLFIQVGENEVSLEETVRFAELAKKNDVHTKLNIWPDMVHGFQTFEELDESQAAIKQVGYWLKTVLEK